MATERTLAREKLLNAGTDLFRADGFVATSVDDICSAAGVTKGAFFHYFDSKEKLAEACLARWGEGLMTAVANAPFQTIADPVEKLANAMDFLAELFASEKGRSCLAGTTVQEVSQTHPLLREAANRCFVGGQERFVGLLEAAAGARNVSLDARAIAAMWMSTIQGSLILCKASGDPDVIRTSLGHLRTYVLSLLNA